MFPTPTYQTIEKDFRLIRSLMKSKIDGRRVLPAFKTGIIDALDHSFLAHRTRGWLHLQDPPLGKQDPHRSVGPWREPNDRSRWRTSNVPTSSWRAIPQLEEEEDETSSLGSSIFRTPRGAEDEKRRLSSLSDSSPEEDDDAWSIASSSSGSHFTFDSEALEQLNSSMSSLSVSGGSCGSNSPESSDSSAQGSASGYTTRNLHQYNFARSSYTAQRRSQRQ
jgi:hypothetical protein